MSLMQFIKKYSVSITVICVVLIWLILMQFVILSIEARLVSFFSYSYFIALSLWAIVWNQINNHEKQITTFLMYKYPGSRPFEYLFFIFLFTSTGVLTMLVTFIYDITQILLENFMFTFTLVFFYAGSITLGWFHYIKRIEG